jgi:hypothetical protein
MAKRANEQQIESIVTSRAVASTLKVGDEQMVVCNGRKRLATIAKIEPETMRVFFAYKSTTARDRAVTVGWTTMADEWAPVGVKYLGPITFTGTWGVDKPRQSCLAQPCPSCLFCGECKDFHGFGKGCTDQTCPLLRPNPPDD